MNGAAIMSSSFLFALFGFVVGKFVWCSSVTTPAPETLLHHKLRRREKVGPLNDRASYLFPYFGILALEQTYTIAIDVSSSHIFVAMFTLDLVRVQEARKPTHCLDLWWSARCRRSLVCTCHFFFRACSSTWRLRLRIILHELDLHQRLLAVHHGTFGPFWVPAWLRLFVSVFSPYNCYRWKLFQNDELQRCSKMTDSSTVHPWSVCTLFHSSGSTWPHVSDTIVFIETTIKPHLSVLIIRQRKSSWQSDHEILGHVTSICLNKTPPSCSRSYSLHDVKNQPSAAK